MTATQTQRQLGIFRIMLVYAGIRNMPNPLPYPYLEPVDEFWSMVVVQRFNEADAELVKECILNASRKISEETAWGFDIELAVLNLDINRKTTFGQVYGEWFVNMMHPRPELV